MEQYNLQFKLQQEEELQLAKFFMDCAVDAVFWLDSATRLLYANKAACRLTGYSQEELLSMTMLNVDPGFSAEVWLEHWRDVKQQGSLSFESLYRTKQGSSLPVEISITCIEYHGREYACISVRNIVKRKQLELDLHKVNEALEASVAEHAADLRKTSEQLFQETAKHKQAKLGIQQALEQEKELSELRKHFIHAFSHELRVPLNIISFSTSAMKRYIGNWTKEKKLQYLDRIQIAIEQIDQLLEQVLLISRLEAGKLKFEPRPLDLIHFCHRLLAEMQSSHSSQCAVNFVNRGDCSTAYIDEKLLQPILTNLLSNAIKYSPAGSTVNLELCFRDGNVIFQVQDQGIGILLTDRQHLFEPFHRGSNVGNIPGTGLGLAVVKKFVDLHNGEISVVSEVDLGTIFTVTLPLHTAPIGRSECSLIFAESRATSLQKRR